jgi:thiamine-phosphate pyrophosphorylase
VNLPRLLVLTDRTQCASVPSAVEVAVGHGARAVVLREKDLPAGERLELAARLRAVLDPVGGLLLLAGSPLPAPSPVDGVHLAAADPFPSSRPRFVGRSCHDAASLALAGAQGCDYVTLSPAFPSASKPGYGPVLGPDGLSALVPPAGPPVYALAGITPDLVPSCLAAGAYGVAVMGAVMRQPSLVTDYLSTLEEA